jgi:hypothetical protein
LNWTNEVPDINDVRLLAEQLRRIPRLAHVVGRDDVDEDAWAIANGLRDIRESCSVLFGELIPSLMVLDPTDVGAEEVLHKIGELLRHIRYHTADSRFFGYLAESPGADDDRDQDL